VTWKNCLTFSAYSGLRRFFYEITAQDLSNREPMKHISNFMKKWSATYKRQKPFGKLVFGCGSLFVLCFACSIPIGLLSPTPKPSEPEPIPAQTSRSEALPTQETIIILEEPTNTPLPLAIITLSPQATNTSQPVTSTVESTPTRKNIGPYQCVPDIAPQVGQVVDVVDGDTIKVQMDGAIYTVRYIGIDTPESTIEHEPFGPEASQKNKELVDGRQVTLIKDVSEADKFGRLLRYVFIDDMFINYELVVQGYANAVTFPPDVACNGLFLNAENTARTGVLGLWALEIIPSATTVKTPTASILITAVNKQAEYVDIKNVSLSAIDLTGWSLVSEKGEQTCYLGGMIQPGETLRIWAGSSPTGFSCGFGGTIWNNNEIDPAVLYNPQGEEVDRYP
jgi:micrococcal nuclease